MKLEEIVAQMLKCQTPFSFAKKIEKQTGLLCYPDAAECQVAIERAVQKALMLKCASLNKFVRAGSAALYQKYRAEYYSCLHFDYKEVSLNDICDAVGQARIIYVGDYHTLKSPKCFTLNVVKQCCEIKGFTITAMECNFAYVPTRACWLFA